MRIPSFEWVNILEYMNLVQYEKNIFLFLISCSVVSCQYNWPITTGYLITSDPAMSEAYESKFGFLLYDKDYTEYIAYQLNMSITTIKIIVAQQDSLEQPTWYIIQPPGIRLFERRMG